jgi:hypothetical protein
LLDDKLWIATAVAALSTLLILAYAVLAPMSNEESTIEQVEDGLNAAANKFDAIRKDLKSDVPLESDPNT